MEVDSTFHCTLGTDLIIIFGMVLTKCIYVYYDSESFDV
jgi:hypothetical protein